MCAKCERGSVCGGANMFVYVSAFNPKYNNIYSLLQLQTLKEILWNNIKSINYCKYSLHNYSCFFVYMTQLIRTNLHWNDSLHIVHFLFHNLWMIKQRFPFRNPRINLIFLKKPNVVPDLYFGIFQLPTVLSLYFFEQNP